VVTSRRELEARGFSGFLPFSMLSRDAVPKGPGVYAVLRVPNQVPTFLEASTAAPRRGRSATVDEAILLGKWVDDVEVIYIGKATAGSKERRGIWKRLDEYRRHGTGQRPGHWGGRYIWQLADQGELLVAWLEADDPSALEAGLIGQFVAATGRLPFANLKRERTNSRRSTSTRSESRPNQ
jgi:hypothetical protein